MASTSAVRACRAVACALGIAGVVAGCGSAANSTPLKTVIAFDGDVRDKDYSAACRLLTPFAVDSIFYSDGTELGPVPKCTTSLQVSEVFLAQATASRQAIEQGTVSAGPPSSISEGIVPTVAPAQHDSSVGSKVFKLTPAPGHAQVSYDLQRRSGGWLITSISGAF